jgi:hypothetical protein
VPEPRSKLRDVVMVARGATDYVLFSCGHFCTLEPFTSRKKPYPRRRMCFRCPRQEPVPIDRERFVSDHGRGIYETLIPAAPATTTEGQS